MVNRYVKDDKDVRDVIRDVRSTGINTSVTAGRPGKKAPRRSPAAEALGEGLGADATLALKFQRRRKGTRKEREKRKIHESLIFNNIYIYSEAD